MDAASVGLAFLPKVVKGAIRIYICLKDPSDTWPRGSGLHKLEFERSMVQAVLPTDSVWAVCERDGLHGLVKVIGDVSPDPLLNYPPPQHIAEATMADIGRLEKT